MSNDLYKFNKFLSQFNVATDAFMDDVLRIGRNYFYADKGLRDFKDSIRHDAFSLGIFLGEEKDEFMPSPALIDMLSKMPGSERLKVFVNRKAEWLFICGRNVLEQSIAKNPAHIDTGIVFVQNEDDENLGYGIFKRERKDLVIRNILDKGKYLRSDTRRR